MLPVVNGKLAGHWDSATTGTVRPSSGERDEEAEEPKKELLRGGRGSLGTVDVFDDFPGAVGLLLVDLNVSAGFGYNLLGFRVGGGDRVGALRIG